MDKPIISGDTIMIPSNLDYLTDVDVFIEGVLRGFGVDESTIADIAISVSELVNNAIAHGNKYSPDKRVTVRIGREDSAITISVADEGSGFNASGIASPIADENLLKQVGRGIFIVRSLMDSVEFLPSGAGSQVVIKKAF
jgi:serine/threonine-protein kinase RsbW